MCHKRNWYSYGRLIFRAEDIYPESSDASVARPRPLILSWLFRVLDATFTVKGLRLDFCENLNAWATCYGLITIKVVDMSDTRNDSLPLGKVWWDHCPRITCISQLLSLTLMLRCRSEVIRNLFTYNITTSLLVQNLPLGCEV